MLTRNQSRLITAAGLPKASVQQLHGGDVSHVVRMGNWVLKTAKEKPLPNQFEMEHHGLQRLQKRGCLTPEVHYVGAEGLVLRYYEQIDAGPKYLQDFAERLAKLHRNHCASNSDENPGYLATLALPGYGGDLSWQDIFVNYRLRPMLDTAIPHDIRLKGIDLEQLNPIIFPEEGRCIIHGDLWQGNCLPTRSGILLIDPSAWSAERGVDIAMLRLFGQLGNAFWDAYRTLAPIPQEVERFIPLYQLYYALAHVNLFGSGYTPLCLRLWRTFWDR